ncbi:MAG: hypothetical protein K9J12_15945 [Melioribacteraceae bacterium]|nr:hypothetical protein [Melioribacteraceae bacterium]MCF8263664.1 hypothetical protein [Melioribacteraceae bacterium]MCF8431400.1 hypothetical protein [Melioribacteraceae bacterium]
MFAKNNLRMLFLLLLLAGITEAQQKFTIDLHNIDDDLFNVTIHPDNLSENNNIFQFAAIAPGTYQIMDIGRFVKYFKAYDKNGEEIETENVSTNQWEISDPENVAKIDYQISETWDTPVEKNQVYPMCGTSLEKDHAYINNHAVLGYFHGRQSDEMWIQVNLPDDWIIGTPLELNSENYYVASSYDFAIDSPILAGRLSEATTDIEGTTVDVFTYSKTDQIKSENLLIGIEDILYAASEFTEGLPVQRYVFLFHFEDTPAGAWEHSYSSNYVLAERELDEENIKNIRSIVAHEFYHVVTPLNIHSELVEMFNFEEPTLSQHLWLYEGVTEWASDAMQFRYGIFTLEDYLRETKKKLLTNDFYNQDISLTELGVNAAKLPAQYANIYMKGAIVGTLLDLLLIDKSNGESGLRELMNNLAKKYGPERPFSEDDFFDELAEMTYPEVGVFIDNYIQGTEPLPVSEYFEYVGIKYTEFLGYDSSKISLGFGLGVEDGKVVVTNVNEDETQDIKVGDAFKRVVDIDVTLQNAQVAFAKLYTKKAGETLDFVLDRSGEEVELSYVFPPQKIKHKFEVIKNPTPEQLKLRKAWMSNL